MKKENKTIKIFIDGGCLSGVENLPKGWDYELFDRDNDPDKYDEEIEKEDK